MLGRKKSKSRRLRTKLISGRNSASTSIRGAGISPPRHGNSLLVCSPVRRGPNSASSRRHALYRVIYFCPSFPRHLAFSCQAMPPKTSSPIPQRKCTGPGSSQVVVRPVITAAQPRVNPHIFQRSRNSRRVGRHEWSIHDLTDDATALCCASRFTRSDRNRWGQR